ncbi:acyl-CoA synthetase short-chain family member 3, mitochondrial [Octopus bimaculoides]|uniref:acyl-CoA synthetase short-chain family member 3, mitochondrial n=1 Tax=Octopus bimaculoides TaxID=37653 RepID=UPI00071C4FEC|nr:acyl-CoA synthetase short-chain family member 3, mitochondrial [Octopus bimaculoides]|eukprot:XP_014773286.1 PREDICTED: acyl-CoA synthetase short-chain family member 3, mitochondrial-like [Octopus bimaculoides]
MAATALKLNRAGTMLTCPHLFIKRFLTPISLLRSLKAGPQYKLLPFNFRFYSTSQCLLHSSPPGYIDTHEESFRQALQDPTTFWAKAAEDLIWHKKWHQVLDNSNPPWTQWFVGGEFNTTYNALDRHVENGLGERVALVHDSPVTGQIQKITYSQLLDEVKHFAGVLRKHGVEKGDRVLIYMPAIPQAIVTMLAAARIGAIHAVVFGGFGAKELANRIAHAKPKVIVSSNCGIEPTRIVEYKPILDEALELISHKPKKCIIFNRPQVSFLLFKKGLDVCYMEELSSASPTDCVPVPAMDPLYILHTSGTTGLPKAIVRPNAGHAVALKWAIQNVYGIKPGEVWWAASDLGWVVGHSFIAYGPLLNANTSILFEGKPVGTPDASAYFRVLKDHEVAGMFVAPTALRAIIKEDNKGKHAEKYFPFSKLKAMYVAGEHCDKTTMQWTKSIVQKPVLDNWWQTETSWPALASCYGLGMNMEPSIGVSGKPVPGWNVKIMAPKSLQETKIGDLGQIVIKLPLPPGAFISLWENNEGYKKIYFTKYPGYYDTMDSGVHDGDGYVSVLTRTDDVINVAGHRLSTGALEEAIMQNSAVADAVVIGVPDDLKGQVPLGLCVLKSGLTKNTNEIIEDVIQIVRESIGPVAYFKQAVIVPALPKTRSGKTARNTIAALAAGKEFKIPPTIEDPNVYNAIREALQSIGFAKTVNVAGH